MLIHVARDGQEVGKFSMDDLRAGLASGKLLRTDLAWSDGLPNWVPLASYPGLAATPPPLGTPPNLPPNLPPALPAAGLRPAGSFEHPRTSGMAIASLVFGILAFSLLPVIAAIPAIVFGHISRGQINKAGPTLRGGGMALAGLIMGYLGIAMIPVISLLAGIAFPVIGEVRLRGKQTKSLSQARQIVLACKLYAQDHDQTFPRTLDELIPDYLPDRSVFICPLSGPNVPVGYEYFGGKETDPAENVVLISKAVDRRDRRVIMYVDGSGRIGNYSPDLPAP